MILEMIEKAHEDREREEARIKIVLTRLEKSAILEYVPWSPHSSDGEAEYVREYGY